MNGKLRLIILSLAAIHVAALFNGWIILFIAPLLMITWEYSIPLLLNTITHKAMPLISIKNDYVYDVGGGIIHVFYNVEPLFNSERLSGSKYSILVTELIQRLALDEETMISFMVINGNVLIRLSRSINADDMNYTRTKLLMMERVISEYFIIRHRLSNQELTELYEARAIKMRTKHLLLITAPMVYLIIYGSPGLLISTSILGYLFYGFIRGKWVFSGLPFNYVSNGNDELFKDTDDEARRSLSMAQQGIGNYCVIIRSNQELSGKARKMYHKANEGSVVKEMGKYYFDAIKWRNVIDRLNSGETPIKFIVLSVDKLNDGFTNTLPPPYVFNRPDAFMHDGLTRDLMIYLPFKASEERGSNSIRIGRDRQGNQINMDAGLLPSMHGIIIGPTGMGKTWTMKTLLIRMMSKGIMPIIIDPHGEYSGLKGVNTIDITKQIINIFDLGSVTQSERISRIAESISTSFRVDEVEHIMEDLELAYAGGDIKDTATGIRRLINASNSTLLTSIYERIGESINNAKHINIEDACDKPTVLTFKGVITSPDVTRFLMMQLIDHIYGYILRSDPAVKRVLVIDEAYYVLSSRLIELYIRGTRKFGLGIFLVTQELGDISSEAIQNIPLNIILAGPDPYVATISSKYELSSEDVRWLTQSLPPQALGGRARAMLIRGPLKNHVLIELEKQT
ncbi:MAG: DUF87 domain-containing protein [Thermocladium sp.]